MTVLKWNTKQVEPSKWDMSQGGGSRPTRIIFDGMRLTPDLKSLSISKNFRLKKDVLIFFWKKLESLPISKDVLGLKTYCFNYFPPTIQQRGTHF